MTVPVGWYACVRWRTRNVVLVLAAIVIAGLPGALGAQPGVPRDDPESWRVAGTAKVLCSALFVSGRELDEARANVSDYFLREKLDSITEVHMDRDRNLVRVTLANRITREAKRYGDQGCVIHQPGRDTVFFAPVRVTSPLPDPASTPWPMGDLLPDAPPPAGLDTAKVRQATDLVFENPEALTAAFVVVYQGRIVAERYGNGAHRDMQLESWSMGKSITGTLVGILIHQGAFRLEDPAPVPEWRKTPGDPRAAVRVMDLLRMSSGLRFSRGSPEDLPGYHDHDLIYTGAIDAFEFAVTRELQFPPNTRGRYRNADVMTLNLLIRDAVRGRGEEYLTWPQRALFDRIGIRRQVLETDPYGNFLLSGYDYGTARNWARLGMLYLSDGVWNGERLLPEGWTRFVSTPGPAWADSAYGGMVWVNARGVWPLPRDAFAFRGAGGQETYVVPSLNLVVVRMGHFPGARIGARDLQRALRLIAEALPQAPRPPELRDYRRALVLEQSFETANLSIADLNGDGHLDLVLAQGRHAPVVNRLMFGDGRGRFPINRPLSATPDRSYAALPVDLDGDGDLDLVVSNDRPDAKLVYRNNGRGVFQAGPAYGRPEWPTRNAAVADLDGDGRPDIVVANRGGPGSHNHVCLNRGAALFDGECTAVSDYPATTISAVDVNGDGFPDLVVPHRNGGQSYVYLNDGTANFPRRIPFGPPDASFRMAVAADLDGDGIQDLVAIDDGKPGTFIYPGQPDGTFRTGPSLGGAERVPYALAAGDLNGDGRSDVIVGYRGAPPVAWFNAGPGRPFVAVEFGDDQGAAYGFAVADLDGDGLADIAMARSGAPSVVYFGSRRTAGR